MTADPFAFASLAAEQVVKGLGIAALPVDPFAIAKGLNIEVAAKPMDSAGVSGMLIRVGNEFAIAYATHLQNEGFERFSVAHELGHFYLAGHPEALIAGTTGIHQSRVGFASTDRYEQEADRFAAGLLMPRHLFFPALTKAGDGLAAIENLRTLCKTSLHATAIRYTQCTRDPVAIVVSEGSRIDHCFMSLALREVPGLDWVKKRTSVPRDSLTAAFNADPANVRNAVREEGYATLDQWFGGNRAIEISEDVLGLGRYGRTLTVLYDMDIPDADDDENERSLIDSWQPRFKR